MTQRHSSWREVALASAVMALLALSMAPGRAQITVGTVSLSSSDGNASTPTAASFGLTPSVGTSESVLTTINPAASLPTTPNLGTTPSDTDVANLNTFLSLPAGTLTGLGAQDGSAYLSQTVLLTLGETVSFDYTFLTDEDNSLMGSQFHNDTSIFTVNGAINSTLYSASSINENNAASFSNTIFSFQSVGSGTNGFQTVSFTVPAPGNYTFGFAVLDIGTNTVKSGLALDDEIITIIPEPGTADLLLGLSAAALALRPVGRWRRRVLANVL